ncbi:MAG: hypothetical protein JWM64_713 [Frankiales bacterium]|nr:hypothetical protein [Frankiales bacterium]
MSSGPAEPDGGAAAGQDPDADALAQRVEERVEHDLEARLDDRLDDVASEAVTAAQQAEVRADRAERAESGAEAAEQGAEQARRSAVEAGTAAVEAAELVAPDDPLLDTAVRRLDAQATPEQPFGRPGRPMSGRSPFRTAFSASLGVALAYGLVQAVISVRSVLTLLLVAAFLAIGLDPVVRSLEGRGLPRGRAVGVVLVGVLLVFVGIGFAVIPPVVDQGTEFVSEVPTYLSDLQRNDRVAELDARYGLLDRAQEYVSRPEQLGTKAVGGVVGVGKVVLSGFFSALTVLILTLYFLSSLPTIKANAYRLVPRSRRSRVGLLTDEILDRVGGYVAGALAIAATAGASTFVLLAVLGVPYPVALSVVVGVTGLVPLIGATIGAAVVVLVAFFTSVTAGVVCAVFYLVYQQVENYVLYPRVMRRSVDVSPAATVVAVLIGGSLLGVIGALLAIPIAAAVQLVLQEVVGPRQDAA